MKYDAYQIDGIRINATAIARGIISMTADMGENYEGALQLGMLPAPLMGLLSDNLKEKFNRLVSSGEIRVPDSAHAERREAFVQETEKAVTHEIYRLAATWSMSPVVRASSGRR